MRSLIPIARPWLSLCSLEASVSTSEGKNAGGMRQGRQISSSPLGPFQPRRSPNLYVGNVTKVTFGIASHSYC